MAIKLATQLGFTKENSSVIDAISKTIIILAPYGKVLVVSTETGFLELGKLTTNGLKRAGNRVINYIVDDGYQFLLENTCGLFCAPEDIRLIICLGEKLYRVGKYFASLRNLPCICISKSLPFDYFSDRIFIKTKKGLDCVKTKVNETLIVTSDIRADLYAHTVRYKLTLFDYYVATYFTDENFDAFSVRRAKSLLDLSESILLDSAEEKSILQVVEFIESALSNFPNLFSQNVTNIIGELCNDYTVEKTLLVMSYALNLFSEDKKTNDALDCTSVAEKVLSIWGIDELETLKALKKQKGSIKTDKDMTKFNSELIFTRQYLKNALKNYQNLGGTLPTINLKDIEMLKLAGSTPYGINLMSVNREIF